MDLINRKEFDARLAAAEMMATARGKEPGAGKNGQVENSIIADFLKEIREWLSEEPEVEAETVTHAHWENERRNSRNMWVANCPVCGSENEDERPHGVSEFHRYCHWCGAKMDKEV